MRRENYLMPPKLKQLLIRPDVLLISWKTYQNWSEDRPLACFLKINLIFFLNTEEIRIQSHAAGPRKYHSGAN